jgi:nitroreductase
MLNMEFDEIIKRRKSVRSFKNKKAPWDKVLEAIDAANQGPFASNINNLKFLIVEDEEMIDQIAKLCDQIWINESKILVLVCSDEIIPEDMHGERGRVYSRQQAGAAVVTMLFKLVDLGLSSCWVGAYNDDRIRGCLGIPGRIQIEAIIPVGYEKEKAAKNKKKQLANTIYWEKWESSKRPEFLREPKDKYSVKQ